MDDAPYKIEGIRWRISKPARELLAHLIEFESADSAVIITTRHRANTTTPYVGFFGNTLLCRASLDHVCDLLLDGDSAPEDEADDD